MDLMERIEALEKNLIAMAGLIASVIQVLIPEDKPDLKKEFQAILAKYKM